MGVLQRFERRIETLVNGAFAKAFKAEVQPVEIASALQRECDDRAAIVSRERTIVPNSFVVELGTHDHERLSVYAEALGAASWPTWSVSTRDEQHYAFVGPVQGRVRAGRRPRHRDVPGPQRTAASSPQRYERGRPVQPQTHLRRPRAVPRRRTARTFTLIVPVTVIGRGADVDLRIDDPGVSRRHAELHVRGQQARVVDLGSTNGIVVDGHRVDGSRPARREPPGPGQHHRRVPRGGSVKEGTRWPSLSGLTLTVIKLGFLAVLWVFVLTIVSVMRTDLFGTRVTQKTVARAARSPTAAPAKPAKPAEAGQASQGRAQHARRHRGLARRHDPSAGCRPR